MTTLLKSKLLWTLVGVAGLVALMMAFMPKPVDMDISKIGNGQQSVVLIYDPNLVASNQQSGEMIKAQEQSAVPVNFLIAKVGDPNSQAFRKRYNGQSLDVLFFDETGKLIGRDMAILTAEALIKRLESPTP